MPRPSLFFIIETQADESKNMKLAYLEKVEKIGPEDREFVRNEQAWLAEWLKERYPSLKFGDINRFLHQMLEVSV